MIAVKYDSNKRKVLIEEPLTYSKSAVEKLLSNMGEQREDK